MKLTVLLWGCNQKLIEKIEHLEASVYELQEAMKDIKKKNKQTKAKAKSKT